MKHFIFIALAIFATQTISAQESRIASPKREFSRMPKDDSGFLNSILDEVPKNIPAAQQAKIRQEITETWEVFWDNNRKACPHALNSEIRQAAFNNTWWFFLNWEALKFDFYWERKTDEG